MSSTPPKGDLTPLDTEKDATSHLLQTVMLDVTPTRPTPGALSETFHQVLAATVAVTKVIPRALANPTQKHLQGTKTPLAPEQRASSSVSSFSATQLQPPRHPPHHSTGLLPLPHRAQFQDTSTHTPQRRLGEEAIAAVAVGADPVVEGVDPSDQGRIVARACIGLTAGQVREARLRSDTRLLGDLKTMSRYDGFRSMSDDTSHEFLFLFCLRSFCKLFI